ncbi:hypothetical protein BD626DRAFT_475855 [Schizophyllum amplum]|uniref:Uncharacterized protein n=1 Tax=Schizophyllum amplum TaxID=97359 RepID=A0A550CYT7_9AGAR|nr:hypothetical protein BD626DRAFT_475855 [Auriculariopsis ampla]
MLFADSVSFSSLLSQPVSAAMVHDQLQPITQKPASTSASDRHAKSKKKCVKILRAFFVVGSSFWPRLHTVRDRGARFTRDFWSLPNPPFNNGREDESGMCPFSQCPGNVKILLPPLLQLSV